jgi:hypothetical protein
MLIITRSQNKNINPNSVIFLSSYADAANWYNYYTLNFRYRLGANQFRYKDNQDRTHSDHPLERYKHIK